MNLHDILGNAPDWTGALCAQSFPELWYPEKGGTTKKARAVCERCPIIDTCLEFIMRTEQPSERFGVWAATTAEMREKMAPTWTGTAA